RYGHLHPELHEPNTRRLLRAIGDLGLMDAERNAALLENFNFLKRVEVLLRRNRNAAVSVIGDSPEEQFTVARWSGFKTRDEFWQVHCRCMTTTRQIVASFLTQQFGLSIEGGTP